MATISTSPRRSLARALACLPLLLSSAQAYSAPQSITLPIDLSPQQTPRLCWAATAEMAVNALVPADQRIDQALEATYAQLGIADVPDPSSVTVDQATFDAQHAACKMSLITCDKSYDPILVGLTYELRQAAQPLESSEIIEELGEQRRPFIFSWQYPPSPSTTRVSGQHYLIAIGYDSEDPDNFLEILDPWPVPSTGDLPTPGGNHAFVSYDTYSKPGYDMGLFTTHVNSRTRLSRFAGMPAPNPPTSLQVDGVPAGEGADANAQGGAPPAPGSNANAGAPQAARARPRSQQVSFSSAIRNSLSFEQRDRELRRTRKGLQDVGPLGIGTPFPIIALRVGEIVAARDDPARLMKQKTNVVLYPVTARAGAEVVDSFLMVYDNGRWVKRGYANTSITRLLVQVRQTYAAARGLRPGEFFLLSIPEHSAFFAGHGRGGNSLLIPVSTDEVLRVAEGQAYAATEVMRHVVEAESRDPSRPSD